MDMMEKNNSNRVFDALAKRYREELFIPEFRDSPSDYLHRIDALLIWLHPSRSNEVECFEIKSDRGDWLSELDNVSKSDSIAKHCDRIWLVTSDEGVAGINEIPTNWGWMAMKGTRFKVIKQAPKQEPSFDRNFVITVAQYVDRLSDAVVDAANRRGFEEGRKNAEKFVLPEDAQRKYEDRITRLEEDNRKLKAIEGVVGHELIWRSPEKAKKFVEAVVKLEELTEHYGLDSLTNRMDDIQGKLNECREKIGALLDSIQKP